MGLVGREPSQCCCAYTLIDWWRMSVSINMSGHYCKVVAFKSRGGAITGAIPLFVTTKILWLRCSLLVIYRSVRCVDLEFPVYGFGFLWKVPLSTRHNLWSGPRSSLSSDNHNTWHHNHNWEINLKFDWFLSSLHLLCNLISFILGLEQTKIQPYLGTASLKRSIIFGSTALLRIQLLAALSFESRVERSKECGGEYIRAAQGRIEHKMVRSGVVDVPG